MRLWDVADRPFQDIANRLRSVLRARKWVKQLCAVRPGRLAFVALETFTGGALGLYAARRVHGLLVCEVNGVYASHHYIPKTRKAIARTIRVLARRLVGAYVQRRATAVRLLAYYGLVGNFWSLRKLYGRAVSYWHKTLYSLSWSWRGNLTWEVFNRVLQRFPLEHPRLRLTYIQLQSHAVL